MSYSARRLYLAHPLVFARNVISAAKVGLKSLCLIATSSTLRQWHAKLEGQRSHEWERGTQECVRHNDFNNLYHLGEN
jgi:hypothetical protein